MYNPLDIIYFFGRPGSGKSTLAAWIAVRNFRRHIKTFCNFDLKYTYRIESSDIGKYLIGGSDGVYDLILDEAGCDFNSRAWKSLSLDVVTWMKKARKYHMRHIYIFSQRHDDVDISIRSMCSCLYKVSKCGLFIFAKKLLCDFDVDKETHQPIIKYWWALNGRIMIFAPLYWHKFNSYDAPELPVKDFPFIN